MKTLQVNIQQGASPVFIVGCYRSGTTLMRMMLSAHSRIHISQETNYIDKLTNQLDSKDLLFDSSDFQAMLNQINFYLSQEGWEYTPCINDFTIEGVVNNWSYPEIVKQIALLDLPERKKEKLLLWGDNTPQYIKSMFFLNEMFPNAKFIVMVRDPRDVAASARKLHFGGKTPIGSAVDWKTSIIHAEEAKESFGEGRVLILKYESLVKETKYSLNTLCRFLGVQYEEGMMNYHQTQAAHQMKKHGHHQMLARPMSSKTIGRYRADLKYSDIKAIELFLADYLLSFDYFSEKDHTNATKGSALIRLCVYQKLGLEFIWRFMGGMKARIGSSLNL